MLLRYRPDARACYASTELGPAGMEPSVSMGARRNPIALLGPCLAHPVPTVVHQMPWLRA
jgi:hypothetical protein